MQSINQWIDMELSNTDEGTIITPQLIPGLHVSMPLQIILLTVILMRYLSIHMSNNRTSSQSSQQI